MLEEVAHLLSVNAEALLGAVTTRNIGDLDVPLDADQASELRDVFAGHIYGLLFTVRTCPPGKDLRTTCLHYA